MSKFVCECGKEFENGQSFNGHKSHCKIHQLAKYGSLDKLTKRNYDCTAVARSKGAIKVAEDRKKRAEKEEFELSQWVNEQHKCEHCGKIMTVKFASGRFCSRSCANSKEQTSEINAKRSATLKAKPKKIKMHFCKYCGCEIQSGTVCESCKETVTHEKFVEAGKKAAAVTCKRSKAEIYFCELCTEYFNHVRHNEPIFNGWDADIIIDDIKMAVLWNGPWHFRHVMDGVSLKQIQNRDKIKCSEIIKCGYTPYIIEDDSKFSKKHVQEIFTKFIAEVT